jgi:hypothetical protein
MRPIYIVLILLAAFPLASFLALYSYGRFVKRVKGEPSFALPVSADETLLDRLIAPLVKQHPIKAGCNCWRTISTRSPLAPLPRGARDAASISNTTCGSTI